MRPLKNPIYCLKEKTQNQLFCTHVNLNPPEHICLAVRLSDMQEDWVIQC